MPETTSITFEAGYERLQQIAGRLNQEDVPVSEMCDLFAEGKGLEQALTGYLDTQRSRVEAIQNGEGVRAFRIDSATDAAATTDSAAQAPKTSPTAVLDTADFVAASAPVAGVSDEEIPF
jgi:exodeoxyribonuclease VII small subunit